MANPKENSTQSSQNINKFSNHEANKINDGKTIFFSLQSVTGSSFAKSTHVL